MISVASLLNPSPPPDVRVNHQLPTPCSSRYTTEVPSPAPQPKKLKMSKDAAVFAKGKIKGKVRYPPHEKYGEDVKKKLREYQIYPMVGIADFCRHIPYNSEKKSFLEKTGRESFEVFQYVFKAPGDDRVYTVMWDYNIGLTTPAKMLNSNPGLRDICHSITGGALAAQGYWMPFEAAKAVAATFCYNIRYALVPLFGEDFLSLCVRPDSSRFGRMVIDKDIVRGCTEAAGELRLLSEATNSSREASVAPTAKPATPRTSWISKNLRPKMPKIDRTEVESGYGTDTDASERYYGSPVTPAGPGGKDGSWAMPHPDSPRFLGRAALMEPPWQSQPPKLIMPWQPVERAAPVTEAREVLGRSKRSLSQIDEDYDVDDDQDGPLSTDTTPAPQKTVHHRTDEERAAYLIMELHIEDSALRDHRNKRRRFSL
ncbi:hypothetical protein FGG08_007405 [Glutinoglossum americanum]|uniref:HTH APSES-type domain-containing protein n=1 Tax=Glutinoglossum americanum TaxID=1670608 RepID=A0A9P8I5E5_9PEZI|nr:hypothetical protein FGG08_007405 [Glutinoglossum americanum]